MLREKAHIHYFDSGRFEAKQPQIGKGWVVNQVLWEMPSLQLWMRLAKCIDGHLLGLSEIVANFSVSPGFHARYSEKNVAWVKV
jgi:hypothetical protein